MLQLASAGRVGATVSCDRFLSSPLPHPAPSAILNTCMAAELELPPTSPPHTLTTPLSKLALALLLACGIGALLALLGPRQYAASVLRGPVLRTLPLRSSTEAPPAAASLHEPLPLPASPAEGAPEDDERRPPSGLDLLLQRAASTPSGTSAAPTAPTQTSTAINVGSTASARASQLTRAVPTPPTQRHEAAAAPQHALLSAAAQRRPALHRWPSLSALLDAHSAFMASPSALRLFPLPSSSSSSSSPRGLLSAHVVVHNEPWLLTPSLLSIAPFVGEIVVVDHGSDDGVTSPLLQVLAAAINTAYGGRFVKLVWADRARFDYGAARNLGLTHATLPLILKWDGDLVAFDASRGDPRARCFGAVFLPWVAELVKSGADALYYNLLNYAGDTSHTFSNPRYRFSRECFVARAERLSFQARNGFLDAQVIAPAPGKAAPAILPRNYAQYPACAVHLKGVKPAEALFERPLRRRWWAALKPAKLTEEQLPLEAWLARTDGRNVTLAQRVAAFRASYTNATASERVPLAVALKQDTAPYTGPPALLTRYLEALHIPAVAGEDFF